VKTVTILGLGPGGLDQMSVGAYRAAMEAPRLLARTERHPAVADLRAEGVVVESLDFLYDTGADFDTVYDAIVAAVLSEAEAHPRLVYAVPGHPLMGERTVSLLLERAPEHGVEVSVVPSPGFVDAALTAARASVDTDLLVLDAHALDVFKLDAALPTLLYQVHDAATASAAKIALMERYPDEHAVLILREGQPAMSVPLYELDRHTFDHLTSVWLPPVPEEARRPTWNDLVRVIATLRAPGGCPWDREQTHESIKRNLLEEAYEAAEAIEKDDPAKLEEELGDLLMQPVMHAVIAAEEGVFTLDDVIAGITTKLIRRHPHVFGDVDAEDTEAVLKNWEAIKRAEKGNADRTSILDGVPVTMPALMRAMDISRKAAKAGFEWPNAPAVLDKVQEEIAELRAEIEANDKPRAAEEIGDLLFSLVNIARWLKIDPEESLRRMVDRFTARFRAMEQAAASDGRELKSLTPEEWDAYWNRAKTQSAPDTGA
jgi:tetrapyrrole methylase family protein/MazG family protein